METCSSQVRSPEFLTLSQIQPLLYYSFPSLRENEAFLYKYTLEHVVVLVTVEDLLKAPLKRWSMNRPHDIQRSVDMAHYLYHSKKSIETVFYMSFNNQTGFFEILDGLHRYYALKHIQTENKKTTDLLTNDFGYNGDADWLYKQRVFVNIRFNALQSQLIEFFQNINKSVPVSDLYLLDPSEEKRKIIESVADKWQIKYKEHFSTSNRPNIPNYTRTMFDNLLFEIYDQFHLANEIHEKIAREKLEKILEKTNETIKNHFPLTRKIPISAKTKCLESGWYMFIYKPDVVLTKCVMV